MSLSIDGTRRYPWRALDQGGRVLDSLGQARRDTAATVEFLRKLRNGLACIPRVPSTDRLVRRQHQRLNNRVEHAHRPIRERERRLRRLV